MGKVKVEDVIADGNLCVVIDSSDGSVWLHDGLDALQVEHERDDTTGADVLIWLWQHKVTTSVDGFEYHHVDPTRYVRASADDLVSFGEALVRFGKSIQ